MTAPLGMGKKEFKPLHESPFGQKQFSLQNKMKALSAKPVARVGGNGFWDPLRLEAYKSQWALISNPGPLHESPLVWAETI